MAEKVAQNVGLLIPLIRMVASITTILTRREKKGRRIYGTYVEKDRNRQKKRTSVGHGLASAYPCDDHATIRVRVPSTLTQNDR